MKKFLSKWLFTITLLLPCLLITVYATEPTVIASGYCGGKGDGTNLTWTLYAGGDLVISGTGAMADWTPSDNAPWYASCTSVKTVTIGNGVTSIGDYAFYGCTGLTRMEFLGNAPVSVGASVFESCTDLTIYYHEGTTGWLESEYYDTSASTWCGYPLVMVNDTGLWTDAKKKCESLGGHLVTITTESEQTFIETLNTNGLSLWIGGYRENENDWKWVTGEDWDYTNWGDGEPNDQGDEKYAAVWPFYWNDLNNLNTYEQSGYICEWDIGALSEGTVIPEDASLFQESYYKIYTYPDTDNEEVPAEENGSWIKAEELCETLGGHLATITSESEQAFIETLNTHDLSLWIGGYRENENDWKWVTGEDWDYTNWGDGEPNDQGDEKYAAVWPFYWNDLNNLNTYEQSGYICEWDIGTLSEGTVIPEDAVLFQKSYYKIYTYPDTDFSGRTVWTCGYCGGEGDGTNLAWLLYNDGELLIAGVGEMTNYRSSSDVPWYSRRNSITTVNICATVTSIGDWAFCACSKLASLTIPDEVTTIGDFAFHGCYTLTNVNIGNSVTNIGAQAFDCCFGLNSINIPDSVIKIGDLAFSACSALTSVTIPGSVKSIGYAAFSECTALTSVTIGNGMTSIGIAAFGECTGLVSVTIPESVTSIGCGAFMWCTSLTEIAVEDGNNTYCSVEGVLFSKDKRVLVQCPSGKSGTYIVADSVTSIENYAFLGCGNLSCIEFLGNAPDSVGDETFDSNLTTIYYHEGTTGWLESEYYDVDTSTWCGQPLVMIPAPSIITDTGRSISLGDQIYINQYVTVSDFDGIDVAAKGGLLIWNSPVAEEDALYGTADTTQKGLIAYGDEYTQRTLGISAKNYADELYLRIYIEVADDAFVYGPLTEYSVQNYCEHKINTEGYTADLKKTCAALLHYGAMAQRYFNYNTNDLANANILEVYPAPAWMTEDRQEEQQI